MKKYLLIIFLLILTLFLYKSNTPKVVDAFLYKEQSVYNDYSVVINSSLKKYLEEFKKFNNKDYIIKSISISHNYNNYINNEIYDIKIEGSNYKDSINEYIEKYLTILKKYNLESEISKVDTGNFEINKIDIYTSEDIYLKIKELFN